MTLDIFNLGAPDTVLHDLFIIGADYAVLIGLAELVK